MSEGVGEGVREGVGEAVREEGSEGWREERRDTNSNTRTSLKPVKPV